MQQSTETPSSSRGSSKSSNSKHTTHRHGSNITVSTTSTPIRVPGGGRIHTTSSPVKIDVTHKKKRVMVTTHHSGPPHGHSHGHGHHLPHGMPTHTATFSIGSNSTTINSSNSSKNSHPLQNLPPQELLTAALAAASSAAKDGGYCGQFNSSSGSSSKNTSNTTSTNVNPNLWSHREFLAHARQHVSAHHGKMIGPPRPPEVATLTYNSQGGVVTMMSDGDNSDALGEILGFVPKRKKKKKKKKDGASSASTASSTASTANVTAGGIGDVDLVAFAEDMARRALSEQPSDGSAPPQGDAAAASAAFVAAAAAVAQNHDPSQPGGGTPGVDGAPHPGVPGGGDMKALMSMFVDFLGIFSEQNGGAQGGGNGGSGSSTGAHPTGKFTGVGVSSSGGGPGGGPSYTVNGVPFVPPFPFTPQGGSTNAEANTTGASAGTNTPFSGKENHVRMAAAAAAAAAASLNADGTVNPNMNMANMNTTGNGSSVFSMMFGTGADGRPTPLATGGVFPGGAAAGVNVNVNTGPYYKGDEEESEEEYEEEDKADWREGSEAEVAGTALNSTGSQPTNASTTNVAESTGTSEARTKSTTPPPEPPQPPLTSQENTNNAPNPTTTVPTVPTASKNTSKSKKSKAANKAQQQRQAKAEAAAKRAAHLAQRKRDSRIHSWRSRVINACQQGQSSKLDTLLMDCPLKKSVFAKHAQSVGADWGVGEEVNRGGSVGGSVCSTQSRSSADGSHNDELFCTQQMEWLLPACIARHGYGYGYAHCHNQNHSKLNRLPNEERQARNTLARYVAETFSFAWLVAPLTGGRSILHSACKVGDATFVQHGLTTGRREFVGRAHRDPPQSVSYPRKDDTKQPGANQGSGARLSGWLDQFHCHDSGWNPVHYAVAFGQLGVLEELLGFGCSVNVRTNPIGTADRSKHEGITALDLANVLLAGDKSTQFSNVICHGTALEEAKSESAEYHRLCNSTSNDASFRKVMERIIARLAKVDAGDDSSNTYHQRPDEISRSNTFDASVDGGDNNSNATSISSNHNKGNASSAWSRTSTSNSSSSNTQHFDAGKKKRNRKKKGAQCQQQQHGTNQPQSKACENMPSNSNSVRATSTSNTAASSQSFLESNSSSHANAVSSISDAANSTTTSSDDDVIARLEQYKDADKDDPGNRLVAALLVMGFTGTQVVSALKACGGRDRATVDECVAWIFDHEAEMAASGDGAMLSSVADVTHNPRSGDVIPSSSGDVRTSSSTSVALGTVQDSHLHHQQQHTNQHLRATSLSDVGEHSTGMNSISNKTAAAPQAARKKSFSSSASSQAAEAAEREAARQRLAAKREEQRRINREWNNREQTRQKEEEQTRISRELERKRIEAVEAERIRILEAQQQAQQQQQQTQQLQRNKGVLHQQRLGQMQGSGGVIQLGGGNTNLPGHHHHHHHHHHHSANQNKVMGLQQQKVTLLSRKGNSGQQHQQPHGHSSDGAAMVPPHQPASLLPSPLPYGEQQPPSPGGNGSSSSGFGHLHHHHHHNAAAAPPLMNGHSGGGLSVDYHHHHHPHLMNQQQQQQSSVSEFPRHSSSAMPSGNLYDDSVYNQQPRAGHTDVYGNPYIPPNKATMTSLMTSSSGGTVGDNETLPLPSQLNVNSKDFPELGGGSESATSRKQRHQTSSKSHHHDTKTHHHQQRATSTLLPSKVMGNKRSQTYPQALRSSSHDSSAGSDASLAVSEEPNHLGEIRATAKEFVPTFFSTPPVTAQSSNMSFQQVASISNSKDPQSLTATSIPSTSSMSITHGSGVANNEGNTLHFPTSTSKNSNAIEESHQQQLHHSHHSRGEDTKNNSNFLTVPLVVDSLLGGNTTGSNENDDNGNLHNSHHGQKPSSAAATLPPLSSLLASVSLPPSPSPLQTGMGVSPFRRLGMGVNTAEDSNNNSSNSNNHLTTSLPSNSQQHTALTPPLNELSGLTLDPFAPSSTGSNASSIWGLSSSSIPGSSSFGGFASFGSGGGGIPVAPDSSFAVAPSTNSASNDQANNTDGTTWGTTSGLGSIW